MKTFSFCLLVLVGAAWLSSCSDSDVTGPGGAASPDSFAVPTLATEWELGRTPLSATVEPTGKLLVAAIPDPPPGSILEYWSSDWVGEWKITVDGEELSALHVHYANGKYYVVASAQILVFNSGRQLLSRWQERHFATGEAPFSSLAADSRGNIYRLRHSPELVVKYSAGGTFLGEWNTHGTDPGLNNWPGAIAVSKDDLIYVSDTLNHRILAFSTEGDLLGEWGTEGTEPGQLRWPTGIAFDQDGFLYVVDRLNERIQKFTDQGVYLAEFPSKGDDSQTDSTPLGIAIGKRDVYVFHANNMVRRFTY